MGVIQTAIAVGMIQLDVERVTTTAAGLAMAGQEAILNSDWCMEVRAGVVHWVDQQFKQHSIQPVLIQRGSV